MPDRLLPSIEHRLAAFQEVGRRDAKARQDEGRPRPVVTISREFGCEAFPVGLRLKELLEAKTGDEWTLMDKALLEKIAGSLHLVKDVFEHMDDSRILDEIISTFTPSWKSHKDYYQQLCHQMVTLARQGNVIIVGRGASVITQHVAHSYHFRMVAPLAYRVNSIKRRLGVDKAEAEEMVHKFQKQRDSFIKDFLNRNIGDPYLYHLIFNNARNPVERIAQNICDYVTSH